MRPSFLAFLLLACCGLAWGDPSPEGICGKLPLVHPKQENQPAFRLSCARSAQAEAPAQVQLLIEGEKSLVLSGVGGEAVASSEVHFDPASVSVRLMEGRPNLYWIRYGYSSEPVNALHIDYQRHWVVPMGDTARTVFDKWTEASGYYRSGFYGETRGDVAIAYQGSTLRVIDTSFRGDNFSDIEHEPDEPDYEKPSRTDFLAKTTREIDAGTGRLISEKTLWAKDTAEYLILDNGVAGWLLAYKPGFSLVKWELSKDGDMFPSNQLPDLEQLKEIPSVAACWLYNRLPWNQADATRIRPPAPPDQIAPAHFAPEHCCNLETSEDGKQVFVYETVGADEQGDGKPGRLLARFDVAAKTCYSAQLAKESRWGKSLPSEQIGPNDAFDQLGNPVFSPDGSQLGYRAKRGGRWFVALNDRRGSEFDLVSSPIFSVDGKHVAYWAKQDKKEFIVLDGKPGPAFDGVGHPIFSPYEGKLAYRAREGNQWFVMLGEQKGPVFDDIGHYTPSEFGRGHELLDVVFSPDGRHLAYAARRGNQWFIVRDGQPGPAFEHVGLPVFSPDSRQLAYRARANDQEFIQQGTTRGPAFDFVGNPAFSPDGHRIAYWARKGQDEFVMDGDHKSPVYGKAGAPVFNRDGSQVVYWASLGKREFIVTGEKKGPEFETIEVPVFDLQTDRAAYRVWEWERKKAFVMLGKEKGPEFNRKGMSVEPVVSALAVGPDGRRLAYVTTRYDDGVPDSRSQQFVVLGNREGPEFEYDGSYALGRPLLFSPDGQTLAYRAKKDGKAFIFVEPPFDESGDPLLVHVTPQSSIGGKLAFDEVGDPVISPDGARLAFWAREGTHWFMRVDTLKASKITPKVQSAAPATVSLSKTVPTLTPHLVVVRETPGSEAPITPIGGSIGKAFVEFDVETLPWDGVKGGKCRPLGQEWTGGLPFKLYSFDQPLGECTGNLTLCDDLNDYHFPPHLELTGCKQGNRFSIGVAGSWNVLPRIPRVLKNHQDFTPIIRKLLDAHGLKQAPVRIEYVHSVDLDGDGIEERFINARSSKDYGGSSTDYAGYAVFLMLGTLHGKPETTVISESWGIPLFLRCEVERSSYADLNGDGAMDLLLFSGAQDEWGLKVKTLQAGKLVDLPLGYWYHF